MSQAPFTWAQTGALFKSTDAAAIWQAVSNGITTPAILSVKVDPNDSAVVYVGTNGGGIFKSSDAGATWSAANTKASLPLIVGALVIDSQNPGTVFAAAGGVDPVVGGWHLSQ